MAGTEQICASGVVHSTLDTIQKKLAVSTATWMWRMIFVLIVT